MSGELPARRGPEADPVLVTAEKVIKQTAARFARSWRTLDVRELEAEGWVACLAARPGYRPETGTAENFFRVVTRRALGRFCSRLVAKVSMGKRLDKAADHQRVVDIHTDHWEQKVDPRFVERVGEEKLRDDPERALVRRQTEEQAERWREAVRALVKRQLNGWSKWDLFVVDRLHGLDGHRAERPKELAARIKVDVRRVYRVHARLEHEIWGAPDLYKLYKGGPERA